MQQWRTAASAPKFARLFSALLLAALITVPAACSSSTKSDSKAGRIASGTSTPEDAAATIESSWEQVVAVLGPTAVVAPPITVDGQLLAATSEGNSQRVQVWHYEGGRWGEGATLGISDGFATVTGIEFVDVTNDGRLDMFVHLAAVLAPGGEIFVSDQGAWRATGAYGNLQFASGMLSGSQPFCPSSQCSTPINVPFTLNWLGVAGFSQTFHDSTNAPITIVETKDCRNWREVYSAPLTVCDAGDPVILLQAALADVGFAYSVNGNNGGLLDGLYGASTAATVRLYQFANGYRVDGIAGGRWLDDLVQRYVSLHPNDLPNYVAKTCRDAMALMAPGGVIDESRLIDALGDCEHSDFITQMEDHGKALLHGLPAEVVLSGYCDDADYYYGIDASQLSACYWGDY